MWQTIGPKHLSFLSKDLGQKEGSLLVKKSSKDLAYLKELILTDLSMILGTLNQQLCGKQWAQSSFHLPQRTLTKLEEA